MKVQRGSSNAFLYVFVTMHGSDALLKAGILLMKCFWLFSSSFSIKKNDEAAVFKRQMINEVQIRGLHGLAYLQGYRHSHCVWKLPKKSHLNFRAKNISNLSIQYVCQLFVYIFNIFVSFLNKVLWDFFRVILTHCELWSI